MASVSSRQQLSGTGDGDEGEEEEEEEEEEEAYEGEDEDDDADFQAPGSIPLASQSESRKPVSSVPSFPPRVSASRAIIPFTGPFSVVLSRDKKPAIEAPRGQGSNKASILDGRTRVAAIDNSARFVKIGGTPEASGSDREPDRKAEIKEHKKRSKNWTRAEILRLIGLRTELAPRFAKAGRKTELWDEIASAMQKNLFSRDAQQCRDKWEKLMAGYKEVRDGLKHKDENPYYEDLHPLLSNRAPKRGREQDASQDLHQSPIAEPVKPITTAEAAQPSLSFHPHHASQTMPSNSHYFQPVTAVLIDNHSPLTSFPIGGHQLHHPISLNNISSDELPFRSLHAEACCPKLTTDRHTISSAGEEDDVPDHHGRQAKRRKGLKYLSTVDLHAIQRLLDSMLIKQQAFLKELLDGMERKEELRERQRQEREERWRVEERDQRQFYTEAMQLLAQKLTAHNGAREVSTVKVEASMPLNGSPIDGNSSLKKRSKNWKRSEVLELIKLRGEMEERFSKSARRAALWAELAEMMSDHGIRRDGKQCREKWDKLMSEYKDVLEGKKDRGNSPYFLEVQASLIGGGLVIVDNPDAGRASAKEEPLNT